MFVLVIVNIVIKDNVYTCTTIEDNVYTCTTIEGNVYTCTTIEGNVYTCTTIEDNVNTCTTIEDNVYTCTLELICLPLQQMYGSMDPRMMMIMGRGMPPGAAAAMMRSPMHHFRPRFM